MNIGIVGYGKIGQKHQEVFEALGCNIVSACSRGEKNRKRAFENGIENTYQDYLEMVNQEKLDGIIISTSLENNFKVAKDLIPFKIPILLEKPPASNEEELEILISLKNKHDTSIMLATNRVWYSVIRNAIAHLGGREKLEGVRLMWSENPNRLINHRNFTEEMVHYRNYSNTIHGFSIIHYLCGELKRVQYMINQSSIFGRNMLMQGVGKFGTVCQFISSWSSILPWKLSFYGDNKLYEFAPLEQCVCTNLETKEKEIIPILEEDKSFKTGFYLQAKAFRDFFEKNEAFEEEVTLESARVLFRYAKNLTDQFTLES